MNAEQCSTVNMETLNFHSAYDYAANSTIGLVNQVCEESISNGLSKHGIHFGIHHCVNQHWSFKKGVRGQIM
jgi:hypothetical protein